MSKLPIIGLAGKARAGKDTSGEFLARKYNGICIALADPLKRLTKQLFNFSDDQLWGESKELIDTTLIGKKWQLNQNFHDYFDSDNPEYYNFVPSSMWDTGKRELSNWFIAIVEEAHEKGISPRKVMQTLGTEFGRTLSRDMWSDFCIENSISLLKGGYGYDQSSGLYLNNKNSGYDYAFIKDIRFRNEIINVNKINGVVYKLFRDSEGASNGISGHASEIEIESIPDHFYDEIVPNNRSKQNLFNALSDKMLFNFGDSRGLN